jgi:hypothetical protein
MGAADLPRVTEVLASVGIIDKGWYERFPEARDRGTAVHMACHYNDVGDLDESSLDPSLIPYLQAWRKFRMDHICLWDHIEERRTHTTYGYTGTPDRVGTVDDHLTIVDIKTGAKADWHPIQLAAYAAMLFDPYRYLRMVVRLSEDGTYALDSYRPNPADLNVFLSALAIHKYLRGRNGN